MAKVTLSANETYTVATGNNAELYGTNEGDEAIIIQPDANVVFDSSFNRGGDQIRIESKATAFTVYKSGAMVYFEDADHDVIKIPAGTEPVELRFQDGTFNLKIDSGEIKLGDQVITDDPEPVGPSGVDPDPDGPSGVEGQIFTLTPIEETSDQTEKVLYWGYTVSEEGADGGQGIPADELIGFLQDINIDLVQLGVIDDDGVDPNEVISNITISDFLKAGEDVEIDTTATPGEDEGIDNSVVTITTTDGQVFSAEASLGEDYLDFLRNLIFDEEGNSRLYLEEQTVSPGQEAEPVVLTPTQNNGRTFETGFTTPDDDTIIAGRTELLHEAYIDGGGGYDTLEVDAKGVYAQPVQLLNIEEIQVQNLPNVYEEAGSGYPDATSELQSINTNSILDLSRATALEKLIVTEGSDTGVEPGDLTIVGIRNGAVARFEGGFSEDVTLHYGEGLSGELDVELAIGDVMSDINLVHNASVLNIDSQGIENHMHSFFAGGSISRMNVKGTGAFGADEDLNSSFNSERPAIIDAGTNTGGLDVTLNGHYNVSIKGTGAYDEITAGNSGDVIIEAYDGDNVIDVDGSEMVDITSGAGADEISAENGEIVTIAAGDGDNQIDVDGSDTVDIVSGAGADTVTAVGSETVMVDSGAGNDDITASALEIDIVAGAGDDNVVVAGLGGGTEGTTPGALNLMMILDDSGSMAGDRIEDLKLAANDMFDQIEKSGVNSVAVTIVFGSTATASTWGSLDQARDVINNLSGSSGMTDYIDALNAAMTAFAGTGAVANATNLSVFISDGYPNEGLIDSTLQGRWETFLSNNDIISHAVGVGDLTDPDPLEPIAYDGVNGTGIDPILGTTADLRDILSDIAGTIGLAGNNALVNLDLGDGENIVQLGDDADLAQGLVAQEGSSITGENITLKVEAASDLQAADLSGITKVIMEDDAGISDPMLTLTAEQFEAIGGANFSVEGSVFHTHAFAKIIVGAGQSVSLTDLGVDDLPRGIDLYIEIQDGATVTMTAEQLHTHVAQNGVVLADDGNTDYVNGKVIITGGGFDFDPFNTSDTVKTVIDGITYYGGSLSEDFMVDDEWYNVEVQSTVNGYDRPSDDPADISITLDSTGTAALEQDGFSTWHSDLEIVGDQDVVFDGPVALGMESGEPTNPFTIDFSALEGEVINFTVDNFELLAQGGGIYGNADNGYASEVLIHIAADDFEGSNNDFGWDKVGAQSLVSSGVERYIVTQIDGPTAPGSPGNEATIVLCDTAQDIETFGLRGNYNDTLIIEDAAWGLAFELQGGGTAKADGPTGMSNVGALRAFYQWDHADAVVDLVHSVAGDTRPIHAAMIEIQNADTLTINSEEGDAIIGAINGGSLDTLDLNAAGDLTIEEPLHLKYFDLEEPITIDATGVTGHLSLAIDEYINEPFALTGGDGGLTLTLEGDSGDPADFEDCSIDGGAGLGTLIVDEEGEFDLSEATLLNIDKVVLEDGAWLWLTMADADAIGASDFSLADDDDIAFLKLMDFDGEPFSVASYPEGYTISLTLANDPVVTLNPATDLTGIDKLEVPEGTILELTAAQFLQLETDAITGDGSVHISGLTQAQVGENGEDLDLSGITVAGDLTISLAESVDLSEAVVGNNTPDTTPRDFTDDPDPLVDVFNIPDGMTLILGDIQDGDHVQFNGGDNSTLQFTDLSAQPTETIDASGFDVDFLRITDLLVSGHDVDYLFANLLEGVEKVIYSDVSSVDGKEQIVDIEPGTTVFDDISFNDYRLDVEVTALTVNMQGGAELSGDLVLSTVEVGWETDQLIPFYLNELVINSTGTEANLITGETANVIAGDITPAAYESAIGSGSRDNNLKNVTINADQDFILEGKILFSSHGSDTDPPLHNQPVDGITGNDDEEATATLNVTGEAGVTIGDLDTGDDDVDALVVNHLGDGDLTFGLSTIGTIDPTDEITVNGSVVGKDTIVITGDIDLSDDTLVNVDAIILDQAANLTLTQDQFEAIYAADGFSGPDAAEHAATLEIVAFDTDNFDATALPPEVTVSSITLAGSMTIENSNLTGVDQIIVPEGATLTISADVFQQLVDEGTIVGVDADGAASRDFTVEITGLTNANVTRDVDGDGYRDADDGFDLSEVQADNVTVTLGKNDVTLGEFDAGVLVADSESVLEDAKFILSNDQTLSLVNSDQADGLDVDGTGSSNTTVVFMFDSMMDDDDDKQIDASGYDVTTLKALATFVGGTNVEHLIDDLSSDVLLQLYHDPEDLGFLNPTFRMVSIEETVTVPGYLVFNDWDPGDEVRDLTINMDGGVEINGTLSLPTRTDDKDEDLVQRFFDTLTIKSQGDPTDANFHTDNTFNMIDGDINTVPSAEGDTLENNLLNVVIKATTQDFVLAGDIVFQSNHAGEWPDANLTVSGESDVTIEQLDVSDAEISVLNVANTGTGTLTITGASPAIFDGDEATGSYDTANPANLETLTFTGTGDILLGENPDVGTEWGISAENLSTIDASGLSGNLDLGVVKDVDDTDFTFTSGTGVTTMTMVDDTLNVGPGTEAGADTDENGWTFDFSDAAAGSELHLDSIAFTKGPLTIDLGANTTLFIDGNPGDMVDLTDIDLTITQTLDIVLADGVELLLTADQADGLDIVGVDTDGDNTYGTVNIKGLGDDPVDFSGIAEEIAGTITLEDDDVTCDPATDLGSFDIDLKVISNDDLDLRGQTIRFTTVAQAGRAIDVIDGGTPDYVDPAPDGDYTNSSNVVWLFEDIASPPINTDQYDPELGRLLFPEDLVANMGGDVESMFTSLPTTILRVDFADVTELDILLDSYAIDRTFELASYTDIPDLTFSDEWPGGPPEEHIQALTIKMGGEVVVGDLSIDDVVASAVDPTDVQFDTLTIESRVALHDEHWLATEDYVNNNNGLIELGEHAQPAALNTIGDIGVGTTDGIDLLNVEINTYGVAAYGTLEEPETPDYNNNDGADLVAATLTFDSAVAGSTALLTITGDNDVTFKSVDATDPDITTVTVDTFLHSGVYTVTGGSPALDLDNTETLNIQTGADGVVLFGTAMDTVNNIPYAGVAGGELSTITITGEGQVDLGVVAQIDGTIDPVASPNGFVFTAGEGENDLILGTANVNDNLIAPELGAGERWNFTFMESSTDSSMTITKGVDFGAGDLAFTMDNAELIIEGNVDLTALENLDYWANTNTGKVVLPEGAALEMTDEQWLASGFDDANFVDEEGNPAVLHVTAALLAETGNDLTLVRGYESYDIDAGLTVTLREDQADVAYVAGDDDHPGVLTGATVTVYVQEENFGDGNLVNLTDIAGVVIEKDTTDNDSDPLFEAFGYEVIMTVAQADSLVGDITKNNNTVGALAGDSEDEDSVDLTDPAGDGSVPAYNLAEVDELYVVDDDHGAIINLTQFNAIGGADGITKDAPVTLMASGDLSAVDLTGIDNLILNANTTLTLLQVDAIAAAGGTIVMDDPAAAYSLNIIDAEMVGNDALPDPDGDGIPDPNSNIDINLGHVTVANVTVSLDTNTTNPADGVTIIDADYLVTGNLNGATLSLTGNGTITADVSLVDGETVTGTTATVNLDDDEVLLNDPDDVADDSLDLSGVAVAVAGTVTLGGETTLDPLTDLGGFDVANGGFDLTGTGAQLSGMNVTGPGAVTVTGISTAAVDLSNIAATGALTAYLLEDPDTPTTAITLNAATDLGIFTLNSGSTVETLTLGAGQIAGGNIVQDGGALTDVVVTDFEDSLGADLTGVVSDDYDTDVQLDSTGNVVISAGADLTDLNGGSQVTISGNGTVTIADETAAGEDDGADVNTTDFVVGDGATLVTDFAHADADSIVDIANVTGAGKLQVITDDGENHIFHQDVRYTELVVEGNDDHVTITDFSTDAFNYPSDVLGRHSVNLDEDRVDTGGNGTEYEELDTGAFDPDSGLVVYTGDIASVGEAGIEDLFDGTTTNFAFAADGDKLYLAADDGDSTYIWLIDDDNNDWEFTQDGDEASLVVTLIGVNDATDLVAANFVDFV